MGLTTIDDRELKLHSKYSKRIAHKKAQKVKRKKV